MLTECFLAETKDHTLVNHSGYWVLVLGEMHTGLSVCEPVGPSYLFQVKTETFLDCACVTLLHIECINVKGQGRGRENVEIVVWP